MFLTMAIAGAIFILGVDSAGAACPAGESYTKPSPGIGPMPCGANQCRPDGHLYFTACVTQSECLAMRGTTDGGNQAGCTSVGGVNLYCCRIYKNRCNSGNQDPNKIFLCTKDAAQCTGAGGNPRVNLHGCGGSFSLCCEFPDSPTQPMKITGESLLPASAIQRQSGGSSASAASSAPSPGASRVKRAYEDIDSFCFTQQECLSSQGKFESGKGCPFKGDQAQGYCVAGDPEYKLQNPMFGVSSISGLRNLIGLVFNGAIGILIIASAMFFVWGAFKYMLSSVVSSIEKSKEVMVDSVVGLALGLGAYALLANINPNLLSLNMLKIYMINRMNFYHVVYCEDLVNQNAKLMDAGTPDAPLSYSAQLPKGFTTTIAESKCGQEYFIEGGDSMAVCMGKSCPGGGICINCSTKLSKDCKTESTIEHGCADCVFGGGLITHKVFKPENVWLRLVCGGDNFSYAKLLAETSINTDNPSDGGFVTNFCFKKEDFKFNSAQIDEFKKECESKGGNKMGMSMTVFIDNEWDSSSGLEMIASIKRTQSQSPYQTFIQRMTIIQAFPLYLLLDTKTDNSFFFVNKKGCDSNLVETSLSLNPGWDLSLEPVSAFLSAVSWVFPRYEEQYIKMLWEFRTEIPEGYNYFMNDLWTLDETKKIVEGSTAFPCGFYVRP